MRQRNRLYTVNKFNKPLFVPEENLFWEGGSTWDKLAQKNYGIHEYWTMVGQGKDPTQMYKQSTGNNWFGLTKEQNPFSKGNLKQTFSGENLGNIAKAGAGAAAGIVGGLANSAISGGLESGAGNAIGSIGSTIGGAVGAVNPIAGAAISVGSQVLGGVTNALFGSSVDEKKLNAAKEGTAAYNNFVSNANSFDDVQGPTAQANVEDAYSGGLFTSGSARKKNEELKRQRIAARQFADRSILNNVNNIAADQMNDALANYNAYGGPLDFGGGALGLMQQNRYFDTIDKRSEAIAGKGQTMQTGFTGGAKTFAGGGDLAASFLDTFGSDPIGAAIRYNQGLEQLAAQREAAQAEAAREQEYADMQKRLLSLETQNQGLQAMIDALPTASTAPDIPEEPATSSTPSRAASDGSTWSYIEDQLRRSGKFNDTQIQGIKYNLQRESSLDPTVVGDGGAAFGLGQWHGSRKPKDMSLEGQTRHLIDTISNFDGKEHWISKKDYEGFLNARTPEEAHYYLAKGYERPRADIVAKVKRDSDMSLKKLKAFGGELGTNGTDFTNGLLYIDEGGSHESNPLDGVPMGLDPEGIPNLVEEGETVYDDYVFSDRMNVPDFMLKDLGLPKSKKRISFADASKKLAQESEKRPNDPISQDGLKASLSRLAEIQETERMKQQAEEYMGLEGYACGGKMKNKFNKGGKKNNSSNNPYGSLLEKIAFDPNEDAVREMMGHGTTPSITEAERQYIAMDGYNPEYNEESADMVDFLTRGTESRIARGNSNPKTYATWMRYAPAVGAGIMSLTDALGLTNKADYTYADRIAAAAERAGYAPNINYNPIGNYLRYNPMDIWYQQNALNAQARATDRALMNTSSPSRAAGLLANGYNSQLASGNLYRQALEYNDAQRERVADFNRKTNMFNSQMGLEAAMANARYHQAAQQMGLSGIAQAAALRDQIDARTGAARSANLSNFLTSLGNIGRENFAMNQLNWDRSRHYTTDASGRSGYKKKSASCGGKLNRK